MRIIAENSHQPVDENSISNRRVRPNGIQSAVYNTFYEVLDFLVQSKRNAQAALKLMRKLLKKQGWTPTRITTDKLRSYHVAIRTLGLTAQHIDNKRANNRAENSHQPVRRRERKQQRFKSPGSAQRFLNIQSAVYNTFYVQRHLRNRFTFKRFRKDAFNVWESASAAA